MNYDERRQERLSQQGEVELGKLEARLAGTRQKLLDALSVLGRHQLALERKQEKGADPGVTPKRIEKKQAQIDKLKEQIREMAANLEKMRGETKRVLDFQPVQDQLTALSHEYRQANSDEWDSLVNSRFKTFQDIFTPAAARVIPVGRNGMSRRRYDELSLEACPVDPELIPDWLIEELELAELEGMSDFEKMEAKVAAIPEIRRLFESTEPLADHKWRRSRRLLEVKGFDEKQDGKLIVPYYIARNGEPKRKGIQVFDSVYEAHRRTLHIDKGYQVERSKLHGIRARIRGIQSELIGMKKGDPRKEEIEKELVSEVELLHFVTNTYKAQAHDILDDVKDIQDSLGRHNPGATCARLVKAMDLLNGRLPDIFEKSRFVDSDKKLLNARIGRDKEKMDDAYRAFLGLCRGMQRGEDRQKVNARVRRLPHLEGLSLRPFRQYAEKLREKGKIVRDDAQVGDHESIRNQAINGFVAAKTFECQHERERILRDIAQSPMQTTIGQLLERSRRLYEVSNSKETFPDVRPVENGAYDEMRGKLRALVERLEHYEEKEMSEAERLAMYERLQAYLESIDFTKVLEKL